MPNLGKNRETAAAGLKKYILHLFCPYIYSNSFLNSDLQTPYIVLPSKLAFNEMIMILKDKVQTVLSHLYSKHCQHIRNCRKTRQNSKRTNKQT